MSCRALTKARAQRRRRAALREEATRLAKDPADRAELVALRVELDGLAPEWPTD
jgi:hypothetical protein